MKAKEEDYLIASRSKTPAGLLFELAQSESESIRLKVAENQSVPKIALEKLSMDPSPEVRAEVAFNNKTPMRNRWKLAMDDSPDVRYRIAENPHSNIELLIWLSTDDNPYIRDRAERTLKAIHTDNTHISSKGELHMSAVKIEQTIRRMLHYKNKLNKRDAEKLKELILADGFVSRSERKVVMTAIKDDKLDSDALYLLREMLSQSRVDKIRKKSIA